MTLAILALLTAQDWWSGEWAWRRPVTLANRADHALAAGTPVTLSIDAAVLKDKGDETDIVLVRDGKRVPFLTAARDGKIILRFLTVAEIAAGKKDAGYALYYGNSAPPANPTRPADLHDYYEGFDERAEAVVIDPAITSSTDKSALVVTDVAAGKTELNPARIVLSKVAPAGAFSLAIEIDVAVKEGAQVVAGLCIEMKEEIADDEATMKRVKAAIDGLADPDWETRETATKELIKIGKPALTTTREAAKSADAEVKWRAEHVVGKILQEHPPKLLSATFDTNDVRARASRTVIIGGKKMHYPASLLVPGRVTIRIDRDEGGDVAITWNGVKRDEGDMKGPVKEVALIFWKGVAGPVGRVAIETVSLSKFVPDEDRPSITIDVEESRK